MKLQKIADKALKAMVEAYHESERPVPFFRLSFFTSVPP